MPNLNHLNSSLPTGLSGAIPGARFIRRRELESIVGLTERQIRRLEDEGRFPRRVKIDPEGRAVAWLESEVRGWIADRVASRVAA